MSNFGADIFDNEPPSKPPARKPRKAAGAKVPEPEAQPAQGEGAAEPQQKKRAPRRRKSAAAEVQTAAEPAAPASQDAPEVVFHARSAEPEAPAEPAIPKPHAAEPRNEDDADGDRRKPRRRGRRRDGRNEPGATQEPGEATPRTEEHTEHARSEAAPRDERRGGDAPHAGPTASELDDEGAGFGVVPHDDADAETGDVRGAGEPFPTFGGERRGRRRRRRGRGRHGDDRQPTDAQGDTGAFPRDEGSEVTPRESREPFPRDPEGPGHEPRPEQARRGDDSRDDRSRRGNDLRDDRPQRGNEFRDQAPRRGHEPREHAPRGGEDRPRRSDFREDPSRRGGDFRGDPSRRGNEFRDDISRRGNESRDDTSRRGNESRDDAEDRAPRPPRRSYADFKPATPPPAAPAPRRIAILLNVSALESEARALGAEISYRNLRGAIAGRDEVVHAVCFATKDLPEVGRRVLRSHGFAIEDCNDVHAAAEALSEQLAEARWPVDVIVVAGSSPRLDVAPREDGPEIELAGFGGNGDSRRLHRTLLRNCMFVP